MDGEATGIGKYIQYFFAGGRGADLFPIVSLVEKIPGLVSGDDIGSKEQSTFSEEHLVVVEFTPDDLAVL